MKEKILITSATGKTGYETAVQLLKDDCSVKIYVRSRNRKALELEKLGAEIAIGEFNDYGQLKNVLGDVNKVYYCHPFMPGMPENVKIFIEAAKQSKIEAVVFMGQWLAEFDGQKSVMTNDTREAYRLFKESGLNVVYLTPGYFAENTFVIVLEFALQLGLMPLPYGKGKIQSSRMKTSARSSPRCSKIQVLISGKKFTRPDPNRCPCLKWQR